MKKQSLHDQLQPHLARENMKPEASAEKYTKTMY